MANRCLVLDVSTKSCYAHPYNKTSGSSRPEPEPKD